MHTINIQHFDLDAECNDSATIECHLTLRIIQTTWNEVVKNYYFGTKISVNKLSVVTAYTRGRLTVNVADSVLLHQLTFYKKDVMDKYNAIIGRVTLRDIVFRVGAIQQYLDQYATTKHRKIELQTMPYAEYLQTPEWKEKAQQKRKEAGYACQLCNDHTNGLHVHHRTYERRSNELMSDLTVLCKDCRKLLHDNKKLAKE